MRWSEGLVKRNGVCFPRNRPKSPAPKGTKSGTSNGPPGSFSLEGTIGKLLLHGMRFRKISGVSFFLTALLCLSADAEETSSRLVPREVSIGRETKVRYLQYLPEDYEKKQNFPLILFLHGGGESGDDLELVKKNGLTREIENGRKVPAIVLAPQNPNVKGLWDDVLLAEFLEKKIEELRVDESRVYLMGLSRGGHGAFRLAFQHPEKFAAAVVVCGGGPVSYAPWAKDVPFWFFHGDSDPLVPTDESRRLSAAVNAAGGEAKLTIYPDTKHDAWSKAFADDEVYEWMFSKTRPE